MDISRNAWSLIVHELQGIRARLDAQVPYAMQMPMVPAAGVSDAAQSAIEQHMLIARDRLRHIIDRFARQLRRVPPTPRTVSWAQNRLSLIKLHFQAVLTQFEIFGEVLSQRAQHVTGLWLAGLDVAAASGLQLPGVNMRPPPLACYVDRGHGGAIRRAHTPLPGGGANPVGIIRMPRERMVGTGIASSLFHEVGHQAAALLGLVNWIRGALNIPIRHLARNDSVQANAWRSWQSWISEWIADLWSVSQVGVAATVGLMGVTSLPRVFVYRSIPGDPHPPPWIRVHLSAMLGEALYPDPQWKQLRRMWSQMYPRSGMSAQQRQRYTALEQSLPSFVNWLMSLRPPTLGGRNLRHALCLPGRDSRDLRQRWHHVGIGPLEVVRKRAIPALLGLPPAQSLAILGQARHDGRLNANTELQLTGELLNRWAMADYLPYSRRAPPWGRVRLNAMSAPSIFVNRSLIKESYHANI